MTDSPVEGNDSTQNISSQQVITEIEGIGTAKQKWLESIGIETLQDLANADPETVESQLQAINHPTSQDVIANWIFQAQKLLMEAVEVQDPLNKDWNTLATFTIQFDSKPVLEQIQYQTTVRHLETAQFKTWSGIEEEKLKLWIHDRLTEPISRPLPQEPDIQVTVIIESLRIYQPPPAKTSIEVYPSKSSFSAALKDNQPFTLEVVFDIQEKELLSHIEEDVFFEVECCAQPSGPGEVLRLDKIPLTPLGRQQGLFTVKFSPMNLSSGTYRLQVLLKLQGIKAMPAFISVPDLHSA